MEISNENIRIVPQANFENLNCYSSFPGMPTKHWCLQASPACPFLRYYLGCTTCKRSTRHGNKVHQFPLRLIRMPNPFANSFRSVLFNKFRQQPAFHAYMHLAGFNAPRNNTPHTKNTDWSKCGACHRSGLSSSSGAGTGGLYVWPPALEGAPGLGSPLLV